MATDEYDENVNPSSDESQLNSPNEPGSTNTRFEVPSELANAGSDTNIPHADSPESIDEEISQGANREDIDPHHSITRPEDMENVKELHEDSFERPE